MNEDRNIYYTRIRELGIKKGYSINELATGIGVSLKSFNQWKTSEIRSSNLISAAKFLGVSTDFLLGLSEDLQLAPSKERIIKSVEEFNISEKQIDMLITVINGILNFRKVKPNE